MRTLSVPMDDSEFNQLVRWKNRVSAAFGTEVTWTELLTAYAADPTLTPKRPIGEPAA